MNSRRSFLAFILGAAVTCLPLFGTTGAILNPTAGTVVINGEPVPAGSAVVAGDRVATSAGGSARMVLPSGSLLAASNTAFRMESVHGAAQIRLDHGLVEISGLLPVALNRSTVVPASSHARFKVYAISGKVYVEAIAGKVTLRSDTRTTAIPAGTTVEFSDAAATAAGLSPTTNRILLFTGMAASAAGLVIAIRAKKTADSVISPSSL
ncbi:MAG: hypothetical protein ACRD0Y_00245 [Terriglobales bacterium]